MYAMTIMTVRKARLVADDNQREDPDWTYAVKVLEDEVKDNAGNITNPGKAVIRVYDDTQAYMGTL